jgi:polysaccharide export outer membrane protein
MFVRIGLCILLVAAVVPAASAREWAPVTAQVSAPDTIPSGGAADTLATEAGLLPGDIVRLRIWREPDLSGEFPVDAHGDVVFPKIGVQRVTGESQDALRDRLVSLYERYLRNPSIDVVFLRRINVLGSVRHPGLIPVDPTMVVADALALAGGTTPDGRQDRIQLIRGGEVLTTDISQRTRIADLPLQSGDQLYVPERSWFSRHGVANTFIAAGLSLVTLLITVAITK